MLVLEVSYGCPSEKYPLNGVFQLDQAKALSEYGHQVVFVALDLRSIRKWRKWGFSQHDYAGIPVFEFNFPFGPVLPELRGKLSEAAFSRILRKVIAKYGKPDIVHPHFGGTASNVVRACKKEGIPYVVTEHSSLINRDDLKEKKTAPYRYAYQNAAAVIAVSRALAKRIKRYSDVDAVVIPNIVDFSLFSTAKVPHEGFRFIAAGNLNYYKGFDVLIEAFARFAEDNTDGQLLIMGDGPEKEKLETLARECRVTDRVSFFGRFTRDEFAEQLSKSDGFVLASRSETFGVVYAEALASGVPVIATRCGGPEDFVNESNGFLVPADDIEALSSTMEELYKAGSKIQSEKIASDIRTRFSGQTIAEKVTIVFTQCKKEEES